MLNLQVMKDLAKDAGEGKCGPPLGVPVEFLCPITCQLMVDPINLCNLEQQNEAVLGTRFERSAIEHYLSHGVPVCLDSDIHLHKLKVVSNSALQDCNADWLYDPDPC